MLQLLAISGSLRQKSYNTALARAMQALIGPDVSLDVTTLHGIPLYDADVEQQDGPPPAVHDLKQRVMSCDGLILVTPEYNNGIPGVFKNAIDWISRPSSDIPQVFGNRATAVIGASPGGFGTLLSQTAWLPVLRTLGARIWTGPRVAVARAHQAFDASGMLTDDTVRKQLHDFLHAFARFAAAGRPA